MAHALAANVFPSGMDENALVRQCTESVYKPWNLLFFVGPQTQFQVKTPSPRVPSSQL